MNAKQVIVIRKDLNMRKGKIVAQGSHASLGALLSMMNDNPGIKEGTHVRTLHLTEGTPLDSWLTDKFTKICVSVDSEQELIAIYEKAKALNYPCALITDAGLTEFKGVPTLTCCAIGPCWDEDVNQITGHLKLL